MQNSLPNFGKPAPAGAGFPKFGESSFLYNHLNILSYLLYGIIASIEMDLAMQSLMGSIDKIARYSFTLNKNCYFEEPNFHAQEYRSMGRIFVSAGHRGWENGGHNTGTVSASITEAQEMILLRDLIVQNLRSRNYEVLSVPDDLSLEQSIDWINGRAQIGDVALEIHASALGSSQSRGVAVFYVAHNEQRKTQAELLLQGYLRRIPQMPNRGAKADTQAATGMLSFVRWLTIPALLMEVGWLAQEDDRRIIQHQRQNMALGIAEGLAGWSRGTTSLPADGTGIDYPLVDINVNGALFDDKGILVEGNAYIPIDLADQLGVEIPLTSRIRRLGYLNIVFVRAADLRDFNLSVAWDAPTRTINLRSTFSICANQIDRLMAHGHTSELQMMMFLKSSNPEGWNNFSSLPKFYREEGAIEGVNYDLAFAQMCIETNYLQFSGAVKPEQNNFGSLGTVGTMPGGAQFASQRLGVRAHIQHLKAYASTEPLVQAIVDPRFRFVRRGVAASVEQLSGRWTADVNYGKKILNVVKQLYEFAGLW